MVIEVSKDYYKELEKKRSTIEKIILIEEQRFQETIDQGLNILEQHITELKKKNTKTLTGIEAFKLYDTYGFPLDLTKEILEEKDMKVDEIEFNKEMEKQKERAREARSNNEMEGWKDDPFSYLDNDIATEFVGYSDIEVKGKLLAIAKDGKMCIRDRLLSLDMVGICGSSGSACTSGTLDPSHVLLAIGLSHEIAHGSLRLSIGKYTKEEDIDYLLQELPKIIKRLRNMSPLYEKVKGGE